jgi:hypothetical protein
MINTKAHIDVAIRTPARTLMLIILPVDRLGGAT